MDETARAKLWAEYSKNNDAEIREQIIIEYSSLVKIVAGRLSMYLGYNVEYEDLVSYGVFGLIDAIDKFDYEKGVKFETYASLRIRGAILDQIRKMDWIPRSLRQKQKKMDAALAKIELEKGRLATDEELEERKTVLENAYKIAAGTSKAYASSLSEVESNEGSSSKSSSSAFPSSSAYSLRASALSAKATFTP